MSAPKRTAIYGLEPGVPTAGLWTDDLVLNSEGTGRANVAATVEVMTLHAGSYQVGVRELHDRLSEHLERVEQGAEVVVTRRGRPIARLSAVGGEDPLEDLVRRGLVTPPARPRRARRARVKARGSVSDLVASQRR